MPEKRRGFKFRLLFEALKPPIMVEHGALRRVAPRAAAQQAWFDVHRTSFRPLYEERCPPRYAGLTSGYVWLRRSARRYTAQRAVFHHRTCSTIGRIPLASDRRLDADRRQNIRMATARAG